MTNISVEAAINAMWNRVEALTDAGEGSDWHLASMDARELESDIRRAIERDETLFDDFHMTSFENFAEVTLAAINQVGRQ